MPPSAAVPSPKPPRSRLSDADYWAGVHGSLSSAGFMQAALRGQHWWRRRDPVHGAPVWCWAFKVGDTGTTMPRILNALSKAWRSPEGDDVTQALKTPDADGRTLWAWAFGHGWGRWNRKFQDAPFGRTIAGHQEGTWAEVIRPLCSPLNAQGEGVWVQLGCQGRVSGTVFPFRPGTSARTLLGSGSRPGHADLLNPLPEMWWGGTADRQQEACTRLFLNDFRFLGKSGEFATELRSWGDLIPPPASDSAPAAHALWALGLFLQGAHQAPQREEWFARFAQEHAPALIKGAPSEWWASGALRGVDPNSPKLARWSDAALAVRMGAVMEEGEAGRRRLRL